MTENVLNAIRLLGVYTAGRFDIFALAGPQKASCRAHIMSTIQGRRIPQAKSGVYAIREAFFAALRPDGGCVAAQEDRFAEICRTITEQKG